MTNLPRWDLSNIFPSLESSQFEQGFANVVARVNALAALFDAQRVERTANAVTDAATVRAFDAVMDAYNATLDEVYTLLAYIQSFVTTDSRNTLAQAKLSALQIHLATLSKLGTRLTAWFGSLDTDALVALSETARAHAYALERARIEAAHQMSPAEEELAAELNLSGGSAWARLHGNVSSQIMVDVEFDGESRELRVTKQLPMSAVRNLAYDANRAVRERAHRAELKAWEQHVVPLAAALNRIKGQMITLSARRHWESALEEAIFDAAIDRAALDAMLGAARESFPVFRRYLRAKARALGLSQLAFYDIFAPLGADTRVWSYEDARDFILTHFGSYSENMQALAKRAFDEHWIDAEPRAGKRDGARQAADAALVEATDRARATYYEFRALARVVFKDPAACTALALGGVQPDDTEQFMSHARATYTAVLETPAYLETFTADGFTAARLQALLDELDALYDLLASANGAKNDALRATRVRNQTFRALDAWYQRFKTITRYAARGRAEPEVRVVA